MTDYAALAEQRERWASKLRKLGWYELARELERNGEGYVLQLVRERARPGSTDGAPYERETVEGILTGTGPECPDCGGLLSCFQWPPEGGDAWRTCRDCGNNIYEGLRFNEKGEPQTS